MMQIVKMIVTSSYQRFLFNLQWMQRMKTATLIIELRLNQFGMQVFEMVSSCYVFSVLRIITPSGRIIREDGEKLSNKNAKNKQLSAKSQKKSSVKGKINLATIMWIIGVTVTPLNNKFTCKLDASIVEETDLWTTLFEKCFSDDNLEHICIILQSIILKYAKFEGGQNFDIDANTLKVFIIILLKSGYVDLSRRTKFWESTADVQNTAV